jgi:hypothetical protein
MNGLGDRLELDERRAGADRRARAAPRRRSPTRSRARSPRSAWKELERAQPPRRDRRSAGARRAGQRLGGARPGEPRDPPGRRPLRGALADLANAIAAEFKLAQRDVLHLLRGEVPRDPPRRRARGARAGRADARAGRLRGRRPAVIDDRDRQRRARDRAGRGAGARAAAADRLSALGRKQHRLQPARIAVPRSLRPAEVRLLRRGAARAVARRSVPRRLAGLQRADRQDGDRQHLRRRLAWTWIRATSWSSIRPRTTRGAGRG